MSEDQKRRAGRAISEEGTTVFDGQLISPRGWDRKGLTYSRNPDDASTAACEERSEIFASGTSEGQRDAYVSLGAGLERVRGF
ncbi:hypothetical protein [Natronorubrum thiooxidans]|uniref:Uncharacterized protein n=1 Tax=Natronorubrum thiooxidans TaxID=308853 RepID=A0A1N7GTR8_9EURY|nr:hypothetical protein [Natronorubrum thiooxidans]SIS15983.1 hypothetical protein SAMN05421752_11572 [Natronorubrum thiooxidans]